MSNTLDDLRKQAGELAEKIKKATNEQLEALHGKLQEAHKAVQAITAEIASLTGKPAGAKRGRKAGSKNKTAKPARVAKAAKKRTAKRGKLGESILKFLTPKGKAGAHVNAIADNIGTKPANVTAWIYATGKNKVKKVAPATFALK